MANVIRTVKEFVEKVKVGQSIWELHISSGMPMPPSLRMITSMDVDSWRYSFTNGKGILFINKSLKDLVGDLSYHDYGPYMGVCLKGEDAQEAYEANMRHFEENGRSPEDEEW